MLEHEHPFAQYVRILGKGKQGTRSLSAAEARQAMTLILEDKVRPEQLGAFLMLLRVKEESPEEISGFVQAVVEHIQPPEKLHIDLDWSSYAGKKNRLPWYLLSALTLAGEGVAVLMHGARGHTKGRMYVEDTLSKFGLKSAKNWFDVELEIQHCNFAYASIEMLSPEMARIIELRPILGLRSPVHTLCRLLNPAHAPYRIDGVFHPAYGPMHQKAARLLQQNNSVTLKGDGGEAEIKPDSDCVLQWVRDGEYIDDVWPRHFPQRIIKESDLDTADLLRVWRGQIEHEYGEAAVTETLAVVLLLMKRADDVDAARQLAEQMWQRRDRQRF